MKRSWWKCVWLLVVLAVSVAGQAQQTGTIRGLVTDPDAAVVPGATITATAANGKALTAQSKGDGSYSISNVPAGSYSITVTMTGFGSFVRQGVRVAAGQSLNLDVKLAIAEANAEVNVTTQTNQVSVDSDSNASATVIKDKDLDALSDDPDELQNQLSALAGPSAGPNGGQIYIDGFTGGTLPPKSSIREIRVNQNPFSAQYEKLGFGRVEILTKPGTDKFRGNINVQGNQKWLNTSSPFVQNQPDYHTFFLLGSLSGPLTKTSSFNVSGSNRDIEDNNIISNNVQIYATNPNDLSTICPPIQTAGCSIVTYSGSAINHPQKRWQISPRFDFALSDKNTLTFRYEHEQGNNKNNNIGSFVLPLRGQNSTSQEDTIQISDSQIISPKVVNETRFEWQRSNAAATALNPNLPGLNVSGGMSTGGSTSGNSNVTDTHFELQNYTSIALQKHFWRFGGRLRTTEESAYSTANANGTFTYATIEDYSKGQVNQYAVSTINQATVTSRVTDVGLYVEDDWKIRPNLTLSAGMRLETQNQIDSNHDIAPRVALAWGIPNKHGSPKTVVRVGYGIFYDRFDLTQVMNVVRQNGTNVQTTTVSAPQGGFLSCGPSNPQACSGSSGTAGKNTVYTIGDTRSAYIMQFAGGVDQQVGKASISVNYLNSRGVHQYLNRAFANTATNMINYRYDSGGVFNQNQIFVNGNMRLSNVVSLFGFYSLNFVNGNASGATFIPSRATDTKADYGRTQFDVRNRMLLAGNMNFKHGFSASPFLVASSGTPYNILAGRDLNGDSVYNDRPAWANASSANLPGACTAAAALQTGQTSNAWYSVQQSGNYTQIPINNCTGPASLNFNLRLNKVFGFGEKTGAAAGPNGGRRQQGGMMPPPGGGGGGGGRGQGGPGGGGPFGGASSGHKYTVNFAVQANNLLNVVNYGPPVGTVSSPQFGRSNAIGGGGFMGPGGSTNAVRRITLQMGFNF